MAVKVGTVLSQTSMLKGNGREKKRRRRGQGQTIEALKTCAVG